MAKGDALSEQRSSLHGLWSSRMAFVLAVTGSAVGLGNIWRFPYIAGENGGGAFVIVYLLCVFVIGVPIMMSEIMLGRRGRRNPITTMQLLGQEEGGGRQWRFVGILGVGSGFLILSFYSVIAGWAIAYVFRNAFGVFIDADPPAVDGIYSVLTGTWWKSLAWHTIFMGMTVFVVARGVERGLERAVRILMPALLILLLMLLAYSLSTGFFSEGARFLLYADFSALTPGGVLVAMGQAFFTLSVGMGAVMAYGAYLPQQTSITGTTLIVAAGDTLIALLAGLIIFPIVFANGLDPALGPGLAFETLPLAFGRMPGGIVFGTLFFMLLSFAAWTSAIGIIESAVAWMVERRHLSRVAAASISGAVVWFLGIATVLSFNILAEFKFLKGTLFDNVEYLSSNILLPLSGLSITIFAGWVMARISSCEELDAGPGGIYKCWHFLARFVAPTAVILILVEAATGGMISRLFAA